MTQMTTDELVTLVARDLVAQVAPQELPLYRATSQAYFKNRDKAMKARAGKDELLGFGVGEAVALLTPYILAILTEVVGYLAKELAASVKTEGGALVNEWVKGVFKKFRQAPGQPAAPAASASAPAAPAAASIPTQPASGMNAAGGAGAPSLSKEQLARVYQIAYQKALSLKLSEARAALLADSVVGSLAIS